MPIRNVRDQMPLTSLDDVVAALDQQRVDDGDGGWVVDVLGIHVAESYLWIQIAQKHRPHESLVLRIASGTTAGDVLRALTRERPHPHRQRVLSIFPTDTSRDPFPKPTMARRSSSGSVGRC